MNGHSLLLPFDTNDSEFSRGFECGRLWALASASDEPMIETVHCTNGEMLLRIGEALGRHVVWTELEDGWAEIELGEPNTETAQT